MLNSKFYPGLMDYSYSGLFIYHHLSFIKSIKLYPIVFALQADRVDAWIELMLESC